ncbi:MAG: transcription-repair coupling factor, partial [Clostridia bacterium]|nr:transcription-repair coupling factor [Clostridia bacterium]
MKFLNSVLSGIPEFRQLYEAVLHERFPVMATGLYSVHKAHLIHHLCFHSGRRALVIAGDEAEGARLCSDITAMGTKAVFYPSRDFTFRNVEVASREFEHQRIGALWSFMSGESRVLVCCADAAVQYTIPKKTLESTTAVIKEGTRISPEELVTMLLSGGYVRVEQIDGTGQFALRGGILDFFMPSSSQPCRVEFWGDEIDTISSFDIETQRRTDRLDGFVITPSNEIIVGDANALADKIDAKARTLRGKAAPLAKEILKNESDLLRSGGRLSSADKFYSLIYEKPADIFDYINSEDFVFVSEQTKIDDKLKSIIWQWGEDVKDYLADGILCKGLDTFSGGKTELLRSIEKSRLIFCENYTRGTCELPLRTLVNFSVRQLSPWSGAISVLCEDLEILAADGRTCVILAGTKKAAENLHK